MRALLTVALLFSVLPSFALALQDSVLPASGHHTVYWSEDWEDGMGLWNATNGVWQVGPPSYGTTFTFDSKCAATNLSGDYTCGTSSRLESPSFTLPSALTDGVLWLGFWHWFNNATYYGADYGNVQIWTQSDGWVDISPHFTSYSAVWAPNYIDISAYAGQTIKVGLFFQDLSDYGQCHTGPGWYVDQLSIFDGAFPELAEINRFDSTADMDWDGWYPDQGVWERGAPVNGISQAHSGSLCFGTNLQGTYPCGAYSRLISPNFTLSSSPRDGKLYFSIEQFCSLASYYGTDYGQVQIDDGSGWTTLETMNWHNNLGSLWTERVFDISAYAGQKVRLGFVIGDVSDYGQCHTSYGWYIDDLQFSEGARYIGNPERFENYAPNWMTAVGVWQVGEPTSGPGAAHSGTRCWGTRLSGDYPCGASDMLSTPPMVLSNVPGLYLRFWQWFSFNTYYGADYGVVSIRVDGGDWTDISNHFVNNSGGWSQFSYDLAPYAGHTVEFGFTIQDLSDYGQCHTGSGWYIDDFEILGMPATEAPPEPYLLNVTISPGPAQLFFPHVTTNIDKVIVYGSPAPDFLPTIGTRLTVLPNDAMYFTDATRPGWPAIYYRVSIVDNAGNESVPVLASDISAVPGDGSVPGSARLTLRGVDPNPFNPATEICFDLSKTSDVVVEVYDLLGRKVADVLRGRLEAGPHRVPFRPSNLASGVYFARVRADGQSECAKMLLLK